MLRSAWLYATVAVAKLARIVPKSMAHRLDDLAVDMVSRSTCFRRMDRRDCRWGKPFIAYAQCEDMDCRHCWTVVSLGDIQPDSDLTCPVCHRESGGIL